LTEVISLDLSFGLKPAFLLENSCGQSDNKKSMAGAALFYQRC
jgi:hypothetical protein